MATRPKKLITPMKPRPKPNPPAEPRARVLIGIPTYDGKIESGINQAIENASRFGYKAAVCVSKTSILTQCFNHLWATALNAKKQHGLSHFCMLHADVVPEDYWLDKMVGIMKETGAHVLSSVIPIKSNYGLTSTAIDDGKDAWHPRRLTLTEVFERDETFTQEGLLINTGLMLVDLSQKWVEDICFRFDDDIILEDNQFKAVGISEDWYFSRWAAANGAKLFATRAVSIDHVGSAKYQNNEPWGQWKTDLVNARPEPSPEPTPPAA